MARTQFNNLTPLAGQDYRLRGFEFAGDPVMDDAIRRWRSRKPGDDSKIGYEDFLRRAYLHEAALMDAYVVSMATDMPLTEGEAMATDTYELAVFYPDTDTYSKSWEAKQPVRRPAMLPKVKRV